ncbi:MAG: hypothetical protein MUO85_00500 [candidate division Zixibacteria bacterium]|nr:hypothetical protein [candidate division Zixibacteria bacterium]
MKKLIYIPVIHTEADMGSMAEPLKKEYIKRYGAKGWNEHTGVIKSMWQGIRQKIFELGLNYNKTRIYQDGLPVCNKELAIASDLAQAGKGNYKIIIELIQRGAKLVGTEDPGLLLEDYNYIKAVTKISNLKEKDKAIRKYEKRASDILERRDEYIANRIRKTLMEGETGVLFMGMRHKVDEILPRDIEVNYLICRLPFKESCKV